MHQHDGAAALGTTRIEQAFSFVQQEYPLQPATAPSLERSTTRCGRIVLDTPLGVVYGSSDILDRQLAEQPPRFNVAPNTPIYIVRDTGDARLLDTAYWGFIPAWSTSLDDGPQPINARAETVAKSSLFRSAFEQRRCLILADRFYEWQSRGGKRKQPYYIRRSDGHLLALGGIWETWHAGESDAVTSAAIITTPANAAIGDLHNRML